MNDFISRINENGELQLIDGMYTYTITECEHPFNSEQKFLVTCTDKLNCSYRMMFHSFSDVMKYLFKKEG